MLIVAVMNIDSVPLSTEEKPLSLAATEQVEVSLLLRESLRHFLAVLKRCFLPHFLGGMGIFLLVAYVTTITLFSGWASPLKWMGMFVALCLFGVAAFGYSLFTSCVLAVRLACSEWNDFIERILSLVQQRTASQLVDMNVGLTKPEAAHLVRGSVRDVFGVVKHQQTGLPRGILVICLGMLAAATRAVLSAKIMKWSGKTIQLGKLFAGKATLVGAIFLNLHFFATVLLGLCYLVGLVVLVFNIYLVILWK